MFGACSDGLFGKHCYLCVVQLKEIRDYIINE